MAIGLWVPPMTRIYCTRRRFPPVVIQHAVWLYFRFTLSLRDVEEMLARRGINASYETIRYWTVKFGPKYAYAEGRLVRPWLIGRMAAATSLESGSLS